MRDKTLNLIISAEQILSVHHPMTLRQIYYQLVARHVIDNNLNQYKRLSNALVKARQEGYIPWDWIEDRTRRPYDPNMWDSLPAFMKTVKKAYRRNVWLTQPQYVLVWVEKDALSGVFEPITDEYGVSLIIGRGYNSWSIKKDMADRVAAQGKPAVILYFGDFDPSGEDIHRDLKEAINHFDVYPEVRKVALTKDDVLQYNLPPDFTKKTDTRSASFIQKYGDMAVELDALPLRVLQEKIRAAIEENLDLSEFETIQEVESVEIRQLGQMIDSLNIQ